MGKRRDHHADDHERPGGVDEGAADGEAGGGSETVTAGEAAARGAEHRLAEALARTEALHEEKLRLLAEFQNYRRRSERERLTARQDGVADLLKSIVPRLQDLERAIDAARSEAQSSLLSGLLLVAKGFADAFAAAGVREIDPLGEVFDVETMEAVGEAPSADVAAGRVVHVAQRGYRFEDRLIQPARVLLSSGDAVGDAGENASEGAP